MATLTPTGGTTYCTVEYGGFVKTYNGSTMDGADFKINQNCLSEWYWDTPVNVTKFSMFSKYYYPDSSIIVIWGRVDGVWVEVWRGTWFPSHLAWDSKVISCNNCTGIRISQKHAMQNWRSGIMEVTVDYEISGEGKAEIVSITAPPSFTPGVSFPMGVVLKNVGSVADMLFMRIKNADTGGVLCEQMTYVNPGVTAPALSCIINLDQTTAFHWLVEAGHVED